MLGSKDERKELWYWVHSEQHKLTRERDDLKQRLKDIDAALAHHARVERACWPNPCKKCSGHGKIRHWTAQDESTVKTCETCKGTGEGPEKDVVTQLGEVPT